jgi:uracil-DNA glycosylase
MALRPMRWTERQRAMLREMGVRLWLPDDDARQAATEPVAQSVTATIDEPRSVAKPTSAAARVVSASEPMQEAPRVPGLAPADWLVVGEPLDPADPQQQLLLDNMLRAIGVGLVAPSRERRAVFLALDLAPADASGARASADAARLRSALETVAPRGVLAFGRSAAAGLLGDDAPLGGLRGRVHAHGGVPVVVTFSLAFLLRHPAEKAKAWADLCLAVRTLGGGGEATISA